MAIIQEIEEGMKGAKYAIEADRREAIRRALRAAREGDTVVIAGKGGGSIKTGRFFPETKGNQGDLLTTLLACAGIPIDRPVGIATKQLEEIKA